MRNGLEGAIVSSLPWLSKSDLSQLTSNVDYLAPATASLYERLEAFVEMCVYCPASSFISSALLHGPAGAGKTRLARGVAGNCSNALIIQAFTKRPTRYLKGADDMSRKHLTSR